MMLGDETGMLKLIFDRQTRKLLGANAARSHSFHPLTILAVYLGFALIALSIL
jgi:pyruvate/2-oxoglutarate dehydrogenase complex dihydrolipoamide dehydrogenase (E3) component